MKNFYSRTLSVRALFVSFLLLFSINIFANFVPQDGSTNPNNNNYDLGGELTGAWTPTDAGLVVKLQTGDSILLSTVIDGVEYFVCDYTGHEGGKFKYTKGNYLKLIPRNADGSYPPGSKWGIGAPLQHITDGNSEYDLVTGMDGIVYIMWSDEEQTLTTESNNWEIKTGALTTDRDANFTCDVAFAIPTVQARVNMDPTGTLNTSHTAEGRTRGTGDKSWAFDGKMGVDVLGNVWREVYWFHKSRNNGPYSYAAFGLTAFNTGTGKAYQINGKKGGRDKQRMLFRLYIDEEHPFETCPNSYFFAHDEQNYIKFLKFNKLPIISTDSTAARKIYTHDHHHCMERVGNTSIYKSEWLQIPESDSAYYYIGKNNKFYSEREGVSLNTTPAVYSHFRRMQTMRVKGLANAVAANDTSFTPKADAYGRIVVDTTSSAENLGATFEPAGYFLQVSTGRNIRMRPNADSTIWTSEEMWTITQETAALSIKATLFTGSEYSETDPGADIRGWSQMVVGSSVPVVGSNESIVGKSGWARIYTNNASLNGGLEFALAETDRHLHYDNNGFIGVEIPDQYAPQGGDTVVYVVENRLKKGFNFIGWTKAADGSGKVYHAGDTIRLPRGETTLYAQATYTGSYNVAFSFIHPDNHKRYFMTHPGDQTRFAGARTFSDWTNVYQGMADIHNSDPKYLSSYKTIGKENTCTECEPGEYVLDPRKETVYGYEDSLVFYKNFEPENEEYIGLYDSVYFQILANNTWAGLFQSTQNWPSYSRPAVDSTKLFSDSYLHRVNGQITHAERRFNANTEGGTFIKYNTSTNQFDAEKVEANATTFQISAIVVADGHYVIIPDTTTAWTDAITFDYHENQTSQEQIWSKLIGKQLMACMMVGKDTTYFHPREGKTLNTSIALQNSTDYRLNQTFTYIRDARIEAMGDAVPDSVKPTMSTTSDNFCRIITSGNSSPILNTQYQSQYIDIVDTIRVLLRPSAGSEIKDYYKWWKKGAAGLHVQKDGSRYRDIIVRTKTYHYGAAQTRLILTPQYERYNFGPLAEQTQQLNFTLTKETFCDLLDKDGNAIQEIITNTEDVTSSLALGPGSCSLPGSDFAVKSAVNNYVIIRTTDDNATSGEKMDTLAVTLSSITISGTTYNNVTTSVPLKQANLEGKELVWSVKDGDKRFFILAGSGGLIFREYALDAKTKRLYKKETTDAVLKIGSANAANSDEQYLTPWDFDYNPTTQTITLKTEYGVAKYFTIYNETTPTVGDASSTLTYRYADININDNANYEEKVRLKYGANQWLKFTDGASPSLSLQSDSATATVFSWSYLLPEYYLYPNGAYPNHKEEEWTYNTTRTATIQTRYRAYREYSMLLDSALTYLGRFNQDTVAVLIDSIKEWKTSYTVNLIRDSRFSDGASGLRITGSNSSNLQTYVKADGSSPINITYGGKYVNIVDTLDCRLTLRSGAPAYRFTGDWKNFKSVEDAHLKIPLIRRTYHEVSFDSLLCVLPNEDYNYRFPAEMPAKGDTTHTFELRVNRRTGTHVLNVNNETAISSADPTEDVTSGLHLDNSALAEIRLVDDYGKTPTWCHISGKTANSISVTCNANGLRAPRSAYLYLAIIVSYNNGSQDVQRFLNYRITVIQPSYFQYANNQRLEHTKGASGDSLVNGMQQVHENKRILYYYNPAPYDEYDQEVELPIRERGFYGWWRWYREGFDEDSVDVGDMDILDSLWASVPVNTGSYDFPFRTIGDSVWVYTNQEKTDSVKRLITMGRYTVFHYPARDYKPKNDPPVKTPRVHPPTDEKTLTYVVDLSNYYDHLPLSTKQGQKNQIDTAMLDTLLMTIYEPTLSVREIFELRPWTEMADTLEHYKTHKDGPFTNDKYLEDHVVMAPTGNRLLLKTEQRYSWDNLRPDPNDTTDLGHSESLLGYYMRDDNWSTWNGNKQCQDTMIWCAGYDIDCKWYSYTPSDPTYTLCNHKITKGDDFLDVPPKGGIEAGREFDTVYYCLRARSKKSTFATPEDPNTISTNDEGDYWFNICRYMIIYHSPSQYGPLTEASNGAGALITNDDIEQNYEILERLNFDYNKPGSGYTVYPHPLPWADASYGYSYPKGPEIPDNRYHNDFADNFAGPGEYGIVNKIPYTKYWRPIQQHGGAENGYMIYCDGMSSAGQVAALSLSTQLCEGQKMYFSAYVANVSNQNNKSCPNFTFSVQGSNNGTAWTDISNYMTGDLQPSDNWYQIFFPINQEGNYKHFRVRVFNMASSFDGNDFTIDDMCIFATKPPLIAYQANTRCKGQGENDSTTYVVLRVDYQGFVDYTYNKNNVYYAIERGKNGDTTFVPLEDKYFNETKITHPSDPSKPDTIYGYIPMPAHDYVPRNLDSVFANLPALVDTFEATLAMKENDPSVELYRQGYIYEEIDDVRRPVMYVLHQAKMTSDARYKVRMSLSFADLSSSICAMTSDLRVTNRMVLELNGEEQDGTDVADMCANSIYDLSLRVKGISFPEGSAPIDLNGSCKNDWLLYGDTARVSSKKRYGYYYSDIEKVVKDILRRESIPGSTNANQFAPNLAAVNKNIMQRIKSDDNVTLDTTAHPYDILVDLVNKGFLSLYQSKVTSTVQRGDSLQYVIFPIIGTGSENLQHQDMEICPNPIFVKLKPNAGGEIPMMIGGLNRDSTQANLPVVVLADPVAASSEIIIHVDSINALVALHSITLASTDDPNFIEGTHHLDWQPDREYDFDGDNLDYYKKGDNIILTPASSNNYHMRPGYNYTYSIIMMTRGGSLEKDGCPVGTVMFTVSVVPENLMWNPNAAVDGKWNNPQNWIGVDAHNQPLHANARFAPLASTNVIIPPVEAGQPYPLLTDPTSIPSKDSVQQVGFVYNKCDSIRFLPGAAMGQQQFLTYNKAVVDMRLPNEKWAFRSAPVAGMLSGDVFLSEADLDGTSSLWEAGEFDASGRNHKTGNASFWLSMYSREVTHLGNGNNVKDSVHAAAAEWSKVANGMNLPLPPAMGWAVYTRTADRVTNADVRLPKNDDIYYYYFPNGDKAPDTYVQYLQTQRTTEATKIGATAGELAYKPASATYTLTNAVASNLFVFGNPTMAYIDIWGFIADNSLKAEIDYMDADGHYTPITQATAETGGSQDTISNLLRYLPPMHAIVLKLAGDATATTKSVTLNANRILVSASQKVRSGAPAPRRNVSARSQGIMTVTAVNPADASCMSRLLIGQGFHDEVLEGEDAILTTINVEKPSSTSPMTPFNIYAAKDGYGMSIDLRDEVLNIPVSFCISELPFEPISYLWFTGVNNIEGSLMLYDALLDTERPIIDGICLNIETPESSHEKRYYIRRRGFNPDDPSDPIATDIDYSGAGDNEEQAIKIIHHGQVYVLRGGHVYSIFGQKVR